MTAPNCHGCAHRGPLAPGSGHHLTCAHPVAKAAPIEALGVLMLSARLDVRPMPPGLPDGFRLRVCEHGLSKGWASWPLDFDAIWIRECSGFAEHIPSRSETDVRADATQGRDGAAAGPPARGAEETDALPDA